MDRYEYITEPAELSRLINEMSMDGGPVGLDIETASNIEPPTEPHYEDYRLQVQRVLRVEYSQLHKQWLKSLLDPFKARPRLLSLTNSDEIPKVIDLDQAPWTTELGDFLSTRELIVQNGAFDFKFLRVHYGFAPSAVWDTLIAAVLLKNGQEIRYDFEEGRWVKPIGIPYYAGLGLHEIVKMVLGLELPKEYGVSYWGDPMLTEEQKRYSANDTRHMPRIRRIVSQELEEKNLAEVHKLECDLLLPVIDMELAGIYIDRERIEKALARARQRHEQVINILLPKLRVDDAKVLNNGAALTKVLNSLGVPVTKTDEDEMARYRSDYRLVRNVLTYKHVFNRHLKPLESYAEVINPLESRIHASFHPLGTETGRFSARNPNLQQVPRNQVLRGSFIAPAGRTLIDADLNQIELRCIADLLPERRMQQALNDGIDLHDLTASHILRKEIKDIQNEERRKAKSVNFGFAYGQKPLGFLTYALVHYGLEFSLEEASELYEQFFELYPDIRQWHLEEDYNSRLAGEMEIRSIYGRRRLIPAELSQWDKFTSESTAGFNRAAPT
jgi:DNA polymerase-1